MNVLFRIAILFGLFDFLSKCAEFKNKRQSHERVKFSFTVNDCIIQFYKNKNIFTKIKDRT